MKVGSEALLDVRLDGEISKDEFQEERTALELDQAKSPKGLTSRKGLSRRARSI